MRARIILALTAATLTLVACGERDIRLRDMRGGGKDDGPEEFAIEPVKPLTQPADYRTLPTPTPGAGNITDATPKQDAVAALGGNPARLSTAGTPPASDGGLVNFSRRYGVPGNIRQTLASEDEAIRRRGSLFSKIRISRVDRYNQTYRRQTLNASAELKKWRARGLSGPSAPPAGRR